MDVSRIRERPVVLDTNVFVAAGFHPASASGRIVAAVRAGELVMMWSDETRSETRRVLARIPRLAADSLMEVFRPECRYAGDTHAERFGGVPDGEDRKFAALAAAADAVLVSSDEHLLGADTEIGFDVMTPSTYWTRRSADGAG